MFNELLDGLHVLGVEGELVVVVLALLIVLSAFYLIYRLLPPRRSVATADTPTPAPQLDPIDNLALAIREQITTYNEGNRLSQLVIQGFAEMNQRLADMSAQSAKMIALMTQQNDTLAAAILEMHTTRVAREAQAGDTIANLTDISKRQQHNIIPAIDASLGGIKMIRDDIAQIDARVKALPTADVVMAIQGELELIRHRVDKVLEVLTLLETRPTELPESVPLTPEPSADPTALAETMTEEKI